MSRMCSIIYQSKRRHEKCLWTLTQKWVQGLEVNRMVHITDSGLVLWIVEHLPLMFDDRIFRLRTCLKGADLSVIMRWGICVERHVCCGRLQSNCHHVIWRWNISILIHIGLHVNANNLFLKGKSNFLWYKPPIFFRAHGCAGNAVSLKCWLLPQTVFIYQYNQLLRYRVSAYLKIRDTCIYGVWRYCATVSKQIRIIYCTL